MKTSYIDMAVSLQEKLKAIYDMVNAINYQKGGLLSPVCHYFSPNDGAGKGPEIILNNRFTINPDLVHFSVIARDQIKVKDKKNPLPEIFSYHGGFRGSDHINPMVDGKNYQDGVDNLFKMLSENVVFVWRPIHPGQNLSHLFIYRWAESSSPVGSFVLFGKMNTNGPDQEYTLNL